METRRPEGGSEQIPEITAALDELEVRFLLDPDTTLEVDAQPGE